MNAEKESNPKKAVHRKKQQQAETLPFSLRETENANSQNQQPNVQKKQGGIENSSPLPGNSSIPAVHGSNPAYSDGSAQMHKQLQASLEKTGELSHPETQQKEMEYKSTLGINELRDYHDAKSANVVQEKTAVVADSQSATDAAAPKSVKVVDKAEKTKIANESAEEKTETKEVEVNTPQTATDNPGFVALQGQINATAKTQLQHESAGKAAQAAQAAALSPSNERESMAQASKVNTMSQQEPGLFSAMAFKAELSKRIAGMKLPKNEEQADDFENNNNIKEVNQQAMGDVQQEKNAASGRIASTTAAKLDIDGQPVRSVAKMPVPNPGKAPAIANVAKAMPVKREATNIEKPVQEQTGSIEEQMKANGVTDTMLANSNEPSFKGALEEKNKAKQQSQAATNQFRNNEGLQLSKTQNEAQAQATHQISGMHEARKVRQNQAHGNQSQTASKDTETRKEIAEKIKGFYTDSETGVNTILASLDSTVAYKFAVGSKAAKAAFEKHVDDNMAAYKKKRYGDANKSYGVLAAAGLWIWDKATGLPDEVNKYFVSGKEVYIKTMNYYITDIASHVAAQLNAAKRKIAKGKKDVQDYVNSLSPRLRKLGAAAISEIQGKFTALEKDVDNKKDALIDVLAKKYAENIAAIDTRIEALKTQNSGFVNQALNALSGVFAFIIEVKNTLMNLLGQMIEVVGAIISDPIGFFSNLIAGVGQGFANFTTNIWTHLKTGFFSWLTGASKGITLTMPEDIFSLKGIFSMSMQLLGLGWEGIRSIGATVVGEPLMKVLETSVEIVQIVRKDGIAGLWEYLKDQFQDLKQTVMDSIMDIIQSQVIQAGIKWILGLLSPVGAFVKAVMAIIDVVKFFIQRAAQIAELIKAFMDSVAAIASGKVGAVATAIENALSKAVPVLIGLLASILGISGLADKVLGVIRKIRQRITTGITKFWNFVKEKGKGFLSKVGLGNKEDKNNIEQDEKFPDGKEKLFAKLRGSDQKINVDGGHTLKFENDGELAVYSNRIGFNELLRQKQQEIHADKTASDYAKKQAALNSLTADKNNFGQELSKYKGKQDKNYSANVKTEYNAMQVILKSIRESLEVVGVDIENTSLSSSQVILSAEGGRAKRVVAQPLTKVPGNTHGSSPGSSVPIGWEKIEPQERSKYWVRAHLLNHHLHGPGVIENLFPAHKEINSGMEVQVEGPAKKALANKDNKTYFYETNLTYNSGDFPTHIKVEFGEYDIKQGKRKEVLHKFDEPLRTPPVYIVNINTESAARLYEVAKLNKFDGMSYFFKNLVSERNRNGIFSDIGDIRARLELETNLREKIKKLSDLINDNKLNL